MPLEYYEYYTGVFSAFSSIFGKFALDSNALLNITYLKSINDMCLNTKYISNHCFLLFGTIKIITIVCMIVCNTLQLINFMKALEKKGSLPVTVISSAVSFLLTGLLGLVLLGEKLSLMWFLGLVLIGIGMIFIAYSQKDSVDTNNTNNSINTVTFAGSNIASKQKHEKHRNRVMSAN